MPTQACIHDCPTHGRLCELDFNHDGDHECAACPEHRSRRRHQAIADRIAAHRLTELVETTPDED